MYEYSSYPMNSTTCFIDGLKPAICMFVVNQKPRDLDGTYELTLLHEERGEASHVSSANTGAHSLPTPFSPCPKAIVIRRPLKFLLHFPSRTNGQHSLTIIGPRAYASFAVKSGCVATNASNLFNCLWWKNSSTLEVWNL